MGRMRAPSEWGGVVVVLTVAVRVHRHAPDLGLMVLGIALARARGGFYRRRSGTGLPDFGGVVSHGYKEG